MKELSIFVDEAGYSRVEVKLARSYILAAGLALQHFLNSIGEADYNPSLLASASGLWSSGRPGPGRAC